MAQWDADDGVGVGLLALQNLARAPGFVWKILNRYNFEHVQKLDL